MFLCPPDRDLVLDRRVLIFANFARFSRFFKNRKSRNGQTMPTIKYHFVDGTTREIEVTNEFYALHLQLVQEEKRNHWKETRRHTSLNYLMEQGIDFECNAADFLTTLIRQEDKERIHKAMSELSDKQRQFIKKVFYEERSLREIARETGISHQALSKQLATIYKKLKKFF